VVSERSLRRASDFDRVRSRGRRTSRDGLTVFVLHREDDRPARVGLAVGRRCGRAVARNRIKRRLRAAVAAASPPAGVDLVAQARPEAREANFQELVETVATGLRRADR
jgi:ribonuclease P protein component